MGNRRLQEKEHIEALKELKPVDYTRDLSTGERAFLKEHQVSEQEFKKMGPLSQHEWKEEMRNPRYEEMRKLNT